MSYNDPHITSLFRKYLEGTVTVQELDELLIYFGQEEHTDVLKALVQAQFDKPLAADLDPARVDAIVGLMDEAVLKQTASVIQPLSRWRIFATRALPYAAAIFLIMSVGFWFYLEKKQQRTAYNEPIIADIAPGGNRATLTFADGRTITLDEAREGIIIGNKEITYNDGALLDPTSNELERRHDPSSSPRDKISTLVLTTPKGGTYQVTLPDGSRVWLNAASTLKYPSRFDSAERVVELEGEAYFEVTQIQMEENMQRNESDNIQKIPFKVVSNGQTVEVLGTEFNISTYPDEIEIKTTLVNGSVRIVPTTGYGAPVIINPGQQVINHGTVFDIQTVDVAQYTAWKDGHFYFGHTPFDEMIRQVARWYDVKVEYQGEIPKETFTGKMQRNLSLMTTLKLLNISNAKIQLENQTLIIQ